MLVYLWCKDPRLCDNPSLDILVHKCLPAHPWFRKFYKHRDQISARKFTIHYTCLVVMETVAMTQCMNTLGISTQLFATVSNMACPATATTKTKSKACVFWIKPQLHHSWFPGCKYIQLTTPEYGSIVIATDVVHISTINRSAIDSFVRHVDDHKSMLGGCHCGRERCSTFQAQYLHRCWIKRTACCSPIPASIMFIVTVLPYHCRTDVDRGRRRAASLVEWWT